MNLSGYCKQPLSERDVFDCLQDAGVVDPTSGTRLEDISPDKLHYALSLLESRHKVHVRRDALSTVRALFLDSRSTQDL